MWWTSCFTNPCQGFEKTFRKRRSQRKLKGLLAYKWRLQSHLCFRPGLFFFPLQDWSWCGCPNIESTFQDCLPLVWATSFAGMQWWWHRFWQALAAIRSLLSFLHLRKRETLRTGNMLAWKPGIGECLQDCRWHNSSCAQRTMEKDSSWEYLCGNVCNHDIEQACFSTVCKWPQKPTKYPTLVHKCFPVWVHVIYWVPDILTCTASDMSLGFKKGWDTRKLEERVRPW